MGFRLGADTLRLLDFEREADLLVREVERERLTLIVAVLTDGAFGVAARRLLRARRFLDRRRGAGEGDFGVAARRRLRDLDLRGALALADRLLLAERDTELLERLLLEAADDTDGDLGVEARRLLLLFGAFAFLELLRVLLLLAERLVERELATLLADEGARGVAARLRLLRARRFLEERRRGEGEGAGAFGTDALRRLRRRLGDLEAFRLFFGFFTLRALGEGDTDIERFSFFLAAFWSSW